MTQQITYKNIDDTRRVNVKSYTNQVTAPTSLKNIYLFQSGVKLNFDC